MTENQAVQRQFSLKSKAVGRTLKECLHYQQEVDAYNPDEVAMNAKKQEFFNESKAALNQV